MRYEFEVTGLTPLLMHNDNIEFADRMEAWRKDPANKKVSKPGDDRSPGWTWIGSLYHDGEHVAIPSDNLAATLRQAGARITLKGMKTFKESAVSGIWIEQEFLPLTVAGKRVPMAPVLKLEAERDFTEHMAATKGMGFSLFAKRARVGQSKHIRIRPRFETWSLRGTADVTAQEITPQILEQIFAQAGRVGLGDWRPGCMTPGRFGMFTTKIRAAK